MRRKGHGAVMSSTVEETRAFEVAEALQREAVSSPGRSPTRTRERWPRVGREADRALMSSPVEEPRAWSLAKALQRPDVSLRPTTPARPAKRRTGVRRKRNTSVPCSAVEVARALNVAQGRQDHDLSCDGSPPPKSHGRQPCATDALFVIRRFTHRRTLRVNSGQERGDSDRRRSAPAPTRDKSAEIRRLALLC
jgi:hypothetical protein